MTIAVSIGGNDFHFGEIVQTCGEVPYLTLHRPRLPQKRPYRAPTSPATWLK